MVYVVTCLPPHCNDVQVKLSVKSGDADLYAREGAVPKIENSNCADCPLCKSRSSDREDSCSGISTLMGNQFFLTVTAHKSFIGGKLVVSGFNLKDVKPFREA